MLCLIVSLVSVDVSGMIEVVAWYSSMLKIGSFIFLGLEVLMVRCEGDDLKVGLFARGWMHGV